MSGMICHFAKKSDQPAESISLIAEGPRPTGKSPNPVQPQIKKYSA
jgi:hypothetical protein